MNRIIIIDDNPDDREWMADLALQAGWNEVMAFDTAEAAYDHLSHSGALCVLLDYKLQVRLGIVHLGGIWTRAPEANISLVTGNTSDTVKQIASALQVGFIAKDNMTIEDLTPEQLIVAGPAIGQPSSATGWRHPRNKA